jgi:hypothetical protein
MKSSKNKSIPDKENPSDAGVKEIRDALANLTLTVANSYKLHIEDRKDYLELLHLLRKEALKPDSKKLPQTTLKVVINYGLETLRDCEELERIWLDNKPIFQKFFLETNK